MSKQCLPLAQRRQELIERCALQRAALAQDIASLRSPFGDGGVRGYLASNKTVTLAAAGVALGLLATRPKGVLKLAAAGLSAWKVAQNVLPMLAAVNLPPQDRAAADELHLT